MKCEDCEYCEFVEFDGYMCTKVDAFINEEIINKNIDCMVYECDTYYNFIKMNSEGCKDVEVELVRTILFRSFQNDDSMKDLLESCKLR